MIVVDPRAVRSMDPATPARFQVARQRPPNEAFEEVPMTPARWGWVGLDLPQEKGTSLLMGILSARNDWPDGDIVRRSDESFSLFGDLQRIIRRQATGSVRVRSLVNGATRVVRNVGLLKSSHDWVARGGELRQEFVKNLVYEPVESGTGADRAKIR